ncbi:MAG: hypothetical protein WC509_07210 [Candidatus Izemoplasmatales bacterium]
MPQTARRILAITLTFAALAFATGCGIERTTAVTTTSTVTTTSAVTSTTTFTGTTGVSTSVAFFEAPSFLGIAVTPSEPPTAASWGNGTIAGDPFGTDDPGNVGDVVESLYGAEPLPDRDLYLRPDTEYRITIRLANPDLFDIASVTLDGVVVTADAFAEGSTATEVVISFHSGFEPGFRTIVLEDVSYGFEAEIRHVTLPDEPSLTVGILAVDAPTMTLSELETTSTTVSMNVDVADPDLTAVFRYAALYDGTDGTFYPVELELGQNVVLFEDLRPGTRYQLLLFSGCDPFADQSLRFAYHVNELLVTDLPYAWVDESVTHAGIAADLVLADPTYEGTLVRVELHREGLRVATAADPLHPSFADLLSGTAYSLVATAVQDVHGVGSTEVVALETAFATTTNAVPSIAFGDHEASAGSIAFAMSADDPDAVGDWLVASIYDEGAYVASAADLNAPVFDGLLSDHAYEIRIVYHYDLGDGLGTRIVTASMKVRTMANPAPEAALADIVVTTETLSFAVALSDPAGIGRIATVELRDAGGFISALDPLAVSHLLEGLASGHEYRIAVGVEADFGDGRGIRTIENEFIVRTEAKAAPVASLQGNPEIFGFSLAWSDPEGTGEVLGAGLYLGDVLIAELSADLRTDVLLASDTSYTARVRYRYDLNDGADWHYVELEAESRTPVHAVPTVAVTDIAAGTTDVTFSPQVTDPNSTVKSIEISLVLGTETIAVLVDPEHRFSGLLTDTEYQIRVSCTYDLRDGIGDRQMVSDSTFRTAALAAPTIAVGSLEASPEHVEFTLTETDPDSLGSIVAIDLKSGGVIVASLANLATRRFLGLSQSTDYVLSITYRYDLNDGAGERLSHVDAPFATLPYPVPTTIWNEVQVEYEEIYLMLRINDPYGIATLLGVSAYRDSTLVEEFDVEWGTDFYLNGLLSNTDYRFEARIQYDLQDGSGVHVVTLEKTVRTKARSMPLAIIRPVVEGFTFVVLEVEIVDEDAVMTRASLLISATSLYPDNVITSDGGIYVAENLVEGVDLTVTVRIYYDLGDGYGERHRDYTVMIRR